MISDDTRCSTNAIDAVRSAFRQYATFRGRARRSEFWWFTLFSLLVSFVATGIDTAVLGRGFEETGPVALLASLALVLPTLAITWRRLHDIDRSGAWYFVTLIPVVGWIVGLVFFCSDSHAGTNRFGASPEHPGAWSAEDRAAAPWPG